MARPTVRDLKKKVAELLELRQVHDRYKELEAEVKSDMVKLKYREVDLKEAGRVRISTSERVTVSEALAIKELGATLAGKVTVVKRSVSNELLKAFVKAEEIKAEQYEALMEKAEKTPVTSLYVRPLK